VLAPAGRIFAAARGHTFAELADAIDDAFARWDRSHLQEFTLADQARPITEGCRRACRPSAGPGQGFTLCCQARIARRR